MGRAEGRRLRAGLVLAASAGAIGVWVGVAQPASGQSASAAASPVVGQAASVGKPPQDPQPPDTSAPDADPASPQRALSAWDAAYLAFTAILAAGSLTLIKRRRLLRLADRREARDPSSLPAAIWFAIALAVYVAWLAGITGGAGLAHRLWPGVEPTDLRFTAVVALGAYALAILAILAAGGALTGAMRLAGLWRAPALRDVTSGLVALALALPVILLLLAVGGVIAALWGSGVDAIAHDTLRSLRSASPASPWWWAVLAGAVILAPIVEEWLYRGFVQTALRALTQSPWLAIVGSAVVFTLAHAGSVGADARTLPSLFVLALGLGVLLERAGSLWPCVIAHAAFNALNVALALAIP